MRDRESSRNSGTYRQLEHKVHDTLVAEKTQRVNEEKEKDGKKRNFKARKRRGNETRIEAVMREAKKVYIKEPREKNRERRREGRRTTREGRTVVLSLSPFLSSPRLASCIFHWVALARDTKGGHVDGGRVVDNGGM